MNSKRPIEEAFSADAVQRARKGSRDVIVGRNEHLVTDEVIPLLARDPAIFQRGGQLVEVRAETLAGSTKATRPEHISDIEAPRLRELISRSVNFLRANGGTPEQVRVPSFVVSAVLARHVWPDIRPLAGIRITPFLRPNGTLMNKPGYDAETGIIFRPTLRYPKVPTTPTRERASEAAQELMSLVDDFPFENEEHRVAWLALVLTLVARPAIGGCVPLFLIDANTAGSGKTLLADVAAMIAQGQRFPRMSSSGDDDEFRKRITALALDNAEVVLLDNVARTLGGASLDAALTSESWSDRILGKSATVHLPLRLVWIATGNNVSIKGDLGRRALHIRLRAQQERPDQRQHFRHPDLVGHVESHRAELVVAALTILRGFIVAKRPNQTLPAWGSFQEWSELIRGSLVWVGLPDPGRTRLALTDTTDRGSEALSRLLSGFRELTNAVQGVTSSDIYYAIAPTSTGFILLKEALAEIVGVKPDHLTTKDIGRALSQSRDKIIGGFRIVYHKKTSKGVLWRLDQVSSPIENADEVNDASDVNDANSSRTVASASSASPVSRHDEATTKGL